VGLFGKNPVETKLVGPTLVASFHASQPPMIWKFDLERNHSFAVSLQGDEGDLELGVTSPRGEFYPIAHFVSREDGEAALAAIQKILMKRRSGWFIKTLLGLLIFVAVIIGILLVASHLILGIFGSHGGMPIMRPPSLAAPAAPVQPGVMQNGVPLPADQVLKPPQ
jgi:hypothetical protein